MYMMYYWYHMVLTIYAIECMISFSFNALYTNPDIMLTLELNLVQLLCKHESKGQNPHTFETGSCNVWREDRESHSPTDHWRTD